MASALERMNQWLREVQAQIEAEIAEGRERFRYRIERGRVIFDDEMRRRHRAAREGLASFLSHARPAVILTAPVIYAMVVPIALLDLSVTLYQHACFRAYGIARVPRRAHVFLDRHQLAYLNGLQKLNCVYCGYANGVIAYAREIAARTEQYWCPIKHSRAVADPHALYPGFVDFGDAEAFRERSAGLRERLRPPPG